ncbi:MAG: peptide chain release factor N(5)-glutamine methyltransferase [Chloroflexi bacterium]|nr:peptide chain release factor N(5)-glutamine methyltransferase [Chloroflexota bacterium]MDL1944406.1 peptide chain release factor N(5)-glutamine methyltransferase [Chloroflexi bacterium CFX2]
MNAGELFHAYLAEYQGETAELDLQLILAHVMEVPRSWLLAHLDSPLTPPQVDSANDAFARLRAGTPLPYILGHWEFYGLDFDLTPNVLIPRPETELLVEKAIQWLGSSPERRTVADIGTGSGVIAVSIAMHVPDARILATDISIKALKVARHNAQKFHVHHKIDFLQCDLLPQHIDPLPTDSHFDLICANLPYIPTQTLHGLPVYGREPTLALDGGEDGLDLFRRLLALSTEWLAPRGALLLEIEAAQGMKALSLAYDLFAEAAIQLHKDLAGRDRLLEIHLHE